MGLKYGGKTISDYSAMRGPCPEGFHVPLATEWIGLKTIMDGLSLTTGDSWRINLHMPFASARNYDNGVVYNLGDGANYWSSSPAHFAEIWSSFVIADNTNIRSFGFSIRAFKDSYITPDSTWTVVQGTLGSAGIFWNQSQGLISITDGTTGYTIMDKNLGATTVYNDGDTLIEANMGNMYQWGNNYGFPSTGSVTTSSIQVDASSYGPGNYYSSSTFITTSVSPRDWSSVQNDNLRGGVTGVKQNPVDIVERYYGGKLIDDYSAMRGPCPEGFHIATISERQSLMWTGSHLGAWNINGRGDDVKLYLRIPFAGIRFPQNGGTTYNGTNWQGYSANLWTSIGPSTSDDTARSFQITASSVRLDAISVRSAGYSVRPFKDVPVAPDSSWTTLYDGSSVAIGAGIFHNSTLGLISISGDGTTWTTIADKNLGATIMYSNGDTLSQANCGNFYQWGNCYGFPFSGNVTTSGTQVDASAYGPRNYYTSSTFITRNSGSSDWSSVKNDNLWGGVTGIQQRIAEVKEVYYNTTKIWPFYPAGIYWSPGIDGGVISFSSNGTDWLTMADKNLGATQVFHPGDTYSQANCGNFYQWGNNYGFPYSGTPSRSTTKVDVSSYGPGNYYSNSTFRRVDSQGEWWTSTNFDLWGGTTGTDEARRGPCSEGRHIPRKTELAAVKALTGYGSLEGKILMPKGGIRDNYSAAVTDSGSLSAIWNSDLEMSTYSHVYNLEGTGGEAYYMPAFGCNIRPFRNEAIMPTDEWTKLL